MLLKLLARAAAPLMFATLTATSAKSDINLVFGTYATDKPTAVVMQFRPFLDHLSEAMSAQLGERIVIRMKIAKEYETGINDLVDGKVDFARFGPASYVTAKDLNPDIRIVAMELKNGKKRFKGIIAVHQDSSISSLSDLKGQSFAFGDRLSTIGRYLSQSHLIDAGITGDKLSNYEFLGRHDLVGTSVGSGKYTAGALKEGTFNSLVAAGEPIKALVVFDNVTKPWLTRAGLEPEIYKAMQAAILLMDDPEILSSIAKDGFAIGAHEDYDFVRQAMRHSENF